MPTRITLVHVPACHYCDDARTVLAELGPQFDLAVELVAADSDAGQVLVGQHRPGMFPLVLVDGVYFSAGRLPRAKLRAQLAARPVVGSRS